MSVFRDTKNRQWTIESNVGTIKRVRDLLKINVLDMADPDSKLIAQLRNEPWTLCDILYAALKPQMDAAGVSDVDFAEAMGGDAMEAGFEAIQELVVNFSSGGRKRLLRKVFDRQKEAEASTVKLALAQLDDPNLMESIRATAKKALDRAMQTARNRLDSVSEPTGSAGSLPGPLE